MQTVAIQDAPQLLNTNDQAMWVLGYNDAVQKMQSQGRTESEQHMQELRAYELTVSNLRAELESLRQGQGQCLMQIEEPAAPQVVLASAIAGAVFDFAGYLTTLPHDKAIHCSAAHEASPMVEAITEWCKRRNLSTDGANVEGWRSDVATHPTPQGLEQAIAAERERICAAIKAEDDYCVDHGDYMLDSNDCIKVVRGEWVRPDFSVGAAQAKQGSA